MILNPRLLDVKMVYFLFTVFNEFEGSGVTSGSDICSLRPTRARQLFILKGIEGTTAAGGAGGWDQEQ